MHVDDLAAAILYLLQMENPPDWINVGSNEEVSIQELAQVVKNVVGFKGELKHDLSKPDGMMRKLMDSSKLRAAGWKPNYDLRAGIAHAYESFMAEDSHRER